MSLPLVKEGVAACLNHALETENISFEWIDSQLLHLADVNPCISDLIQDALDDPELHNAYGLAFISILVYKMLETQSDADQLAAMLGD
jgi:hypothetical protein